MKTNVWVSYSPSERHGMTAGAEITHGNIYVLLPNTVFGLVTLSGAEESSLPDPEDNSK